MSRFILLLAATAILATSTSAQSDWKQGRATYYGDQPWSMNINDGACGFEWLWPDQGTGLDIVAVSDSNPDFSGSCGRCYEVQCDPSDISDSFGNQLDRTSVCLDPEASVMDACPCNMPGYNAYSNKRWCCGDTDHFDMSIWAFEKLADTKWGVIGLKYRPVPCDYVPAKIAPSPSDPFPVPDAPSGATRVDRWGSSTPIEADTQVPAGDAEVLTSAGSWQDSSWSADVQQDVQEDGKKAVCATIQPGGALAFGGSKGEFDGKLVLQAWVKTSQGLPELSVDISGSGNSCQGVALQGLQASATSGEWSKYNIYMGLFDSARPEKVVAFASAFKGCAGMTAAELDKIEIRNNSPSQQSTCWADVRLLSE